MDLTLWIFSVVVVLNGVSANECTQSLSGICMSLDYGLNGGCPFGHKYTLSFCGALNMCCINYYQQVAHTAPPLTWAPQPVTWAPQVTSNHFYTQPQPSGGLQGGTCGSTMDFGVKMVGGTTAHLGQFPWQVSLQYTKYGRQHLCGGTLVSPQWVVTAAHCFHQAGKNPTEWVVGLGLQNQETAPDSNFVHVENIYPHEQFNYDGHPMKNDIAMMKLSKPVDISGRYVRASCLPSATDNFENEMCIISGWGSHYFAQPASPVSQTLEYVDVQTMPNSQCAFYDGADSVQSNTICAGHTIQQGGHGPCTGDSGGPLVCKKNGLWTLTGITSWGDRCAEPGKPGIFTRVTSFTQWIDTHLKYY